MSAYATQTSHNRGFLRSNGVEVSVFAMMAGLGVAMFLALTILGGDGPTSLGETPQGESRQNAAEPAYQTGPLTIGGTGSRTPSDQ